MKFKDEAGKEWSCRITVATVNRVREGAEVDLLGALQGDLVHRLGTDLELMARVLWCVCEPQADAAGISPEQFADLLAGDVFADAIAAFMQGLAGFFTHPDQRQLILDVIEKVEQAQATAYQVGREKLGQIDAEEIVRREAAKLSELESSRA